MEEKLVTIFVPVNKWTAHKAVGDKAEALRSTLVINGRLTGCTNNGALERAYAAARGLWGEDAAVVRITFVQALKNHLVQADQISFLPVSELGGEAWSIKASGSAHLSEFLCGCVTVEYVAASGEVLPVDVLTPGFLAC